MLVATTGIYGNYRKRIRSDLERHDLRYEAELSPATSVLIAKRLDGLKYEAAQRRRIPCLTPAWVLMGKCCVKRMTEFEVGKSLLGMEVCGTSLSDEERRGVRDVCKALQAVYTSTLTQCCILLVLSRSLASSDQTDEKIAFARKNHITVMRYDQFVGQYGIKVALRHVDHLPAAVQSSSGIIAYCTPPEQVTDSVRDLFTAAGATFQSSLTVNTTHIIVLAPTTESFIPRAKLEFVSLSWLKQCAALRTRVAVDPYRVKVPQGPVIAFTSIDKSEREELRRALGSTKSLPCIVQDDFVLGSRNDNKLYNTTHLVVKSAEAAAASQKVNVLSLRACKLRTRECLVVVSDWVHDSLKSGRWLNCTRFSVALPELSSLRRLTSQKTSMPKTELISNDKREACGRSESRVNPNELPDEESGEKQRQQQQQEAALCDGGAPTEVKEISQDAGRPNSLESIIEALESKASVPIHTALPELYLEQLPTANAKDVEDRNHMTNTTSFSLQSRRKLIQSQVVVYSRESTNGNKRFSRTPSNDRCNAAVPAASHVEIVEKEKLSTQPPRVCLMIPKALADIQECLPRLQSMGCALATTIEECTHYVTAKPSRTEFFLSSVAAGKWVLAPSFIEETLREGRIAREESHEWSPALARAAQQHPRIVELVHACALQRRRIDRPFASWRVILCCANAARAESFARVLHSGGCEVTKFSTPSMLLDAVAVDTGALRSFTHILSDDDVWDKEQVDSIMSRICNISSVLRMEFIAHYLCTEAPEPERYNIVSSLRTRKRSRGIHSG